MSALVHPRSAVALLILAAVVANPGVLKSQPPAAGRAPLTGPETEKRFPPLQLPKGFKATLFACDPLVEYPSVIAKGPKPGTLFVAHDYVTGLGIDIVRRDEVRLLRDTDGDGYADKSTVFAKGFNSIQGLEYHNGTVFVMHAPLLTALEDINGDGVADRRRDIVNGLGLPPENNPNRLHCANGVVAGFDGWLYLALGDRGCDVKRPEGDRLLFQQGGILRCRPDGRDLHVFAEGLRNIYDVVLDEDLNVFVRDNENDGGDYMIRVCRSFFGADHGYPYLYRERPQEALRPLADLGRGSSAGGTGYLETAFPPEYRDSLFFCEWGRAVVRYRRQAKGSGFAAMQEIDFAAGATNDPYGFKPTDLVVDYDGSLLVSDWCDGQRPKRGRGRIYRISAVGAKATRTPEFATRTTPLKALLAALDSLSGHVRISAQSEIERRGAPVAVDVQRALKGSGLRSLGRMHAVWILARLRGGGAMDELFRIAANDPDPRVRIQAVRAVADLTDPVLLRHRLDAGRGDVKVAARLAALVTKKTDPRMVLEVLVALGRLRWSAAPEWLARNWTAFEADPPIAHAAMQLLRRADNWPAVLRLLDAAAKSGSKRPELRTVALRAIGDRAEAVIVDGVIERLRSETNAARRRDYLDALARVHRKPAAWTYWGFRPAPRPANSVAWDRTAAVEAVLARALADRNRAVRAFALKRMRRENVPVPLASLTAWLNDERDAARVADILDALSGFSVAEVRAPLSGVIRDRKHVEKNRLLALAAFVRGVDASSDRRLLDTATALEDGPVLAAVLRAMAVKKLNSSGKLLMRKLDSESAAVRAAAIESLAVLGVKAAAGRVVALLDDKDINVRRAAAVAAGTLSVEAAVGPLQTLAASRDDELFRASLRSLGQLGYRRAVPQALEALKLPATQLAGLEYLESFGSARYAPHLLRLAAVNRSSEVAVAIVRALAKWLAGVPADSPEAPQLRRAIAEVHGANEVLLHWSVAPEGQPGNPRSVIGDGADAVVRLKPPKGKNGNAVNWRADSEVVVRGAMNVEFLGSADGAMTVSLNGKSVFQQKQPNAFRPDTVRFNARLATGMNRLRVDVHGSKPATRFHLRFRLKSSKAEHERLVRMALRGQGSVVRGREVFLNAEKSQCVKCHRLGDAGGRIGPDLTGVGSRFSTIHLVESLLEPSRTIAPSYATVIVALNSGRVLTGVKTQETATTITLGDQQGKLHTVPRKEIAATRTQTQSTMPDGLEKRLTPQEFVDLIAYLRSQKKAVAAAGK